MAHQIQDDPVKGPTNFTRPGATNARPLGVIGARGIARAKHTKADEVDLKTPKLRTPPFETIIVDRYRRREVSVEDSVPSSTAAGWHR